MPINMKRTALIACLLLVFLCGPLYALADWTSPTGNLGYYENLYGEAAEAYKTIAYGAESARVADAKGALSELGFFPNRPNNNYNRSMEKAVRVFATQLRIGGDGRELTPLMQAMLADVSNMPRAISPVIVVNDYTSDQEAGGYTPYNFARLSRSSVREEAQVGFDGRITGWHAEGGVHYYVVQMEEDAEKRVYVRYEPLPRTTVFQPGDEVTVFGVTQGEQALAFAGMEDALLLVRADRLGYGAP